MDERPIVFRVVLITALFFATPALADIACVQSGLTDLGFDPGPVDGAIGKRTTDAAALFAANAGLVLEPLTKQNSEMWCEAIASFAATPAAQTLSRLDLVSEPEGVLSERDLQRLWTAYETAGECFKHPVYGKLPRQRVTAREPEAFAARPWSSPFTAVRGAGECRIEAGNLYVPLPIPVVKLDERYGQRQVDVDVAASWFRRLSTYLRLSDDPLARSLLKDGLLSWAEGKALEKGIRVSWGARPVDYQMTAAILSILGATAELAGDLSPEERAVVGPWLHGLVKQVAASTWKDRHDDHMYMRAYVGLLWGLITGDDAAVQDAIFTYKLAIHDMRPDGSHPVDSQRGGMGINYNSQSTSQLVMIAVALKQARNVDLFSYEVDGRSIHNAVDWVVASIKAPGEINSIYAISCPGGGDLLGTIAEPNTFFTTNAGYLLAYAALFPDRESSRYIESRYPRTSVVDLESVGGAPACQFALQGGDFELAALVAPPPRPVLAKAKVTVSTKEEFVPPWSSDTRFKSLFASRIDGGEMLEYAIEGQAGAGKIRVLSFIIDAPLGSTVPSALKHCGARTDRYDDGQYRAVIDFDIEGGVFTARNADCIIDALPAKQAAVASFLIDSFADIAIGLVASGGVEDLAMEGMRSFFTKVAYGEIVVGR